MMFWNLATVGIVMLAAFSAIYLSTYANVQRENTRKLEFAQTMLYPQGDAPEFRRFARGAYPMYENIPETPEERYEMLLSDIANSERMLTELLVTLVIIFCIVLAVFTLFSYRFAMRAVRPIEENYDRQKQFVADASHELRTPLAVISANIEAITASGEETVSSQSEWFGYIKEELQRTGKLVDGLLYLAKSENIRNESNLPFNLSAVCETACTSMEAVLYETGKELTTDIRPDVYITADSEKIMQVLYILLDNAGKYASQAGKIAVTLTYEKEYAVLRVMNSSGDMPPDELTKIFERFYRSDTSRSHETGGTGLGLSIAKIIVENSGGSISADNVNGATTFTVCLRLTRKN
jgi:signal transduction histidine kinase